MQTAHNASINWRFSKLNILAATNIMHRHIITISYPTTNRYKNTTKQAYPKWLKYNLNS